MGQDLSEDLLADFEVSLAVKILEEALSVEPVSTDYFFEGFDATLDGFAVFSRWFLARIDGLGPNVFYFYIQVLLHKYRIEIHDLDLLKLLMFVKYFSILLVYKQ